MSRLKNSVPDLAHAGEVGHVRHGDEGGLGVRHTLFSVQEVEFSEM